MQASKKTKGNQAHSKSAYQVGDKVQWKWLGRLIVGSVEQIFTETVIQEIKGKQIKRKGSQDNPAYLVKSAAGNLALKLQSELTPSNTNHAASVVPKMFS